MPDVSQSIAKRSVVARNLETVEAVLQAARKFGHILTPFCRSAIPQIPNGWDVYFHQYTLDLQQDQKGNFLEKEVYRIEGTSDYALTKIGLWKLEQLAGVSWEDPNTGRSTIRRVDEPMKDENGREFYHPHICRYQATGYIRDIDGQIRTSSDGFGYDLRDGSPMAESLKDKPKQLAQLRKNIEQQVLTKAKLRVLRSLLGLKSSYKLDELKKPFVVLKMSFNLDTLDPEVRKQLDTIQAAKQMGIEKELFSLWTGKESNQLRQIDTDIKTKSLPVQPPVVEPLELPAVAEPELELPEDGGTTDEEINAYYDAREAQIARIEELYLAKTGKTREQLSPDKEPLEMLQESELKAIEDALSKKPDLKK
jgi:hypothetical protein